MGDCDLIAPVSEVGRGGVGDGDASVLTARAADRNRERGLTLGHVPGHDDVEEAEPGLHELLRHGIVKDEVRDLLVVAREGSHLGVIEGVREEAHVDHEVGLGGKPVLEAERVHGDGQARALLARREQRQATAQQPLGPSSIIALWGKPITVQDALDHNFVSPAPRPKQATFASFMGTDEPNGRPQAKWNATLDGLTPSEIQAHIDQLYTSEVTSALRDMVHAYEIAMGVAVSRVSVRSMKTRWGSCTPKTGAIRIARELAAYPVECLDMVVAHELVHLLEPSHNQRFHALLDTYCPNNRALSQRLKQPPIETY